MEKYAWSFEVACSLMVRTLHVRVRVRARVGKWVLNYFSAKVTDIHGPPGVD